MPHFRVGRREIQGRSVKTCAQKLYNLEGWRKGKPQSNEKVKNTVSSLWDQEKQLNKYPALPTSHSVDASHCAQTKGPPYLPRQNWAIAKQRNMTVKELELKPGDIVVGDMALAE